MITPTDLKTKSDHRRAQSVARSLHLRSIIAGSTLACALLCATSATRRVEAKSPDSASLLSHQDAARGEVTFSTYLSMIPSGTPWVDPIQLSSRSITSARGRAADIAALNPHLTSPDELLSAFDRYILARAAGQTSGDTDRDTDSDAAFEAQLSLSHNWPGQASGYLLNAHFMPEHDYWVRRRFRHYGTPEMLATIKEGVRALRARFPNAPRLILGDLSKRYGGHFPPHLSHQSGRDADIGYFVRGKYSHLVNALVKVNRRNIDVEKTWTFLAAMIKTGLVEQVFIDYQLQRALYRHAKKQGDWSVAELRSVFSYPARRGRMIRHIKGHSDHMHVRFRAPFSERAATQYMREHRKLSFKPRRVYARARSGESVARLARRFRVGLKSIMQWNRFTPAQARKPLKKSQRVVVGYYTPYALRRLDFTPDRDVAKSRDPKKVFISAR